MNINDMARRFPRKRKEFEKSPIVKRTGNKVTDSKKNKI